MILEIRAGSARKHGSLSERSVGGTLANDSSKSGLYRIGSVHVTEVIDKLEGVEVRDRDLVLNCRFPGAGSRLNSQTEDSTHA